MELCLATEERKVGKQEGIGKRLREGRIERGDEKSKKKKK